MSIYVHFAQWYRYHYTLLNTCTIQILEIPLKLKNFIYSLKVNETYNKTITIQKFTNKVNFVKYDRLAKNH